MTIRARKLIGTVALLAFLAAYACLAMLVAVVLQVNSSKLVELLFYVVGGLAWVVPAAWLVRWMQRPDASTGDQAETGTAGRSSAPHSRNGTPDSKALT